MNRPLTIINFLGVIVLAVLCAFQWSANRRVNLEASKLEKVRQEQVVKLGEKEKTLQGCMADLELFRGQLTQANSTLKDAETKVAANERAIHQLTTERDQLKSSVTNWAAAVSQRDEQLKKANDQLQKLADDRNGAVVKFNELARKYNDLVKNLDEARARLSGSNTTSSASSQK
jgi:chromosome segregation ATPase